MRTNYSYGLEAQRWMQEIKVEDSVKADVAKEVGFDPANLEFMSEEQKERVYAALFNAATQVEAETAH
jgi:hypothetical protein